MAESEAMGHVKAMLKEAGAEHVVYSGTQPNPTVEQASPRGWLRPCSAARDSPLLTAGAVNGAPSARRRAWASAAGCCSVLFWLSHAKWHSPRLPAMPD